MGGPGSNPAVVRRRGPGGAGVDWDRRDRSPAGPAYLLGSQSGLPETARTRHRRLLTELHPIEPERVLVTSSRMTTVMSMAVADRCRRQSRHPRTAVAKSRGRRAHAAIPVA